MVDEVGTRHEESWARRILDHSGTETDRRNQFRFLGWNFAWAVAFVAASWVLSSDIELATWAGWTVAIGTTVLFAISQVAYLRFLRQTDELVRQTHLQGLALSCGVGLMLAIGYPLFEHLGAPHLSVETIAVTMLMVWAIGQVIMIKRYR